MSNLETMVRPGQDGVLTWALPVGEKAEFPVVDIKADTGTFSCPFLVILLPCAHTYHHLVYVIAVLIGA